MRAQGENLHRFVAEDTRGRHTLPLIIEIADGLVVSRDRTAAELKQLEANIEHIKQIVAAQQSYAKAGGVHQTFDPAELFSDALRLMGTSVERHGVAIATDYPTSRNSLFTDRHLALQIIVNLVGNAMEAVKSHRAAGDRQVTLRLREESGRVSFTVQDNGIGIAPENRERLFQHGFTTRKDGHGFGLHSGAIAARNLGGTLAVESDGLGCGARFTLHLPFSPPAARS
jgi:signal transduction histidine kinase